MVSGRYLNLRFACALGAAATAAGSRCRTISVSFWHSASPMTTAVCFFNTSSKCSRIFAFLGRLPQLPNSPPFCRRGRHRCVLSILPANAVVRASCLWAAACCASPSQPHLRPPLHLKLNQPSMKSIWLWHITLQGGMRLPKSVSLDGSQLGRTLLMP